MSEISYPFEPFKIKTVESIPVTTRKEREKILWDVAKGNIFNVPARAITIDLLTDSGTGAMSDMQWAAIMSGDESYASSKSWEVLEATAREIFGMPFILPAHQGRGAEHLVLTVLLESITRPVVPGNGHFDTTSGHIQWAGGVGVDCICDEARDPHNDSPFKGDLDPGKLRAEIKKAGVGNVPLVILTITANTAAGQPVSMKCIRDVSAVCKEYGIPLFFDAARFSENAYFIKTREKGYGNKPIPEIVKEMFSYVDGASMSSKKDGLVNIGGLVVCRDRELYRKLANMATLFEGFPTYGGQAGRDIAALAVGLREGMDEHYLAWRIGQTRYLGAKLRENGVPVFWPTGGHAVYLNISEAMEDMPLAAYPGIAFQNAVYVEGGVRVCEIGTILAGRDPDTGEDRHPRFELVRLAIPRRVYTQTQMDYVVGTITKVYEGRENLKGIRLIYEPPVLRHFTAEYAEMELARKG
ncbi:MAG: tryptophanase [bacterium]|nr:tryptophanase [bacterium]